MTTDKWRQSLDEYIRKNYIALDKHRAEYSSNSEITKSVGEAFAKKESFTLEYILNDVGDSFHDRLFMYIDMSGMTDVEVYKRANLDRKLFSKIRSNPAQHPRKQTVLALAIALKLSIDDTKDLLSRAEYAFSPGSKGDLIVKYFIERGVYDIMTINFALDEYEQPILG